MAKTSTTSLSVNVTGDGVTETFVPPTAPIVNGAAPAGGPIAVALSTGDNTLTVPPGAMGMLLVPSSGSVVVKKFKGVGGDTGITISPSNPTFISLPTGATTVLLNASVGETVSIFWT